MTHYLWTKMIRREFVEAGLNNGRGLLVVDDQIAVFTMLSIINRMCLIPDRLYNYVQHPGQTIRKYDFSLWLSIITMFERYQEILNQKNLDTEGLRIRTWINLNYTISQKMIPNRIDMITFADHISMVRNSKYMREFFRPLMIPFGLKENVKYWFWKLKSFRIIYLLFSRRP